MNAFYNLINSRNYHYDRCTSIDATNAPAMAELRHFVFITLCLLVHRMQTLSRRSNYDYALRLNCPPSLLRLVAFRFFFKRRYTFSSRKKRKNEHDAPVALMRPTKIWNRCRTRNEKCVDHKIISFSHRRAKLQLWCWRCKFQAFYIERRDPPGDQYTLENSLLLLLWFAHPQQHQRKHKMQFRFVFMLPNDWQSTSCCQFVFIIILSARSAHECVCVCVSPDCFHSSNCFFFFFSSLGELFLVRKQNINLVGNHKWGIAGLFIMIVIILR